MKLAEYSIKNRAVLWTLILLIAMAGMSAYNQLGRLEDPEFTIKEAVITTVYPGATAEEVEEEVTEPLETALQQLKQLHEIRSISRPGLSIIRAEMEDHYDKETLPQVWDEMRRKIGAAKAELPPGVMEPIVNDDFGDVYGIFFALTGDGYSQHDLKELAEDIRLELMLCEEVGRIGFWGIQQEVVWVKMDQQKMSTLGISPMVILNTIQQQSSVVSAGMNRIGSLEVRFEVTGDFDEVRAMEELLITGRDTGERIRIGDVVTIERGYLEPPTNIMYHNGKPAIGIGISTVLGGNVVTMGDSVSVKLDELGNRLPVGVELEKIAYQSETVTKAVNGFVLNLFAAVLIVLVLLVIFMGVREGLIIGVVLLLTILATFFFMQMNDVLLQRISLGALIIALGMLVDNAIVVTEGIMIKVQFGKSKEQAAMETVKETKWPLLGATIIAILAFASISLSNDDTGEFLKSLFQVIGMSLGLSWVLAVTVTPFLCVLFLKNEKVESKSDPYNSKIYRAYKKLLKFCLTHRWIVMGGVMGVLFLAFWGFGFVKQNFFPDASRPQFAMSFYLPEGTHIRQTEESTLGIQDYVKELDGVTDISTFVGGGAMRFMLTYAPEMPKSNYGMLLVSVEDYREIPEIIDQTRVYLNDNYPDLVHDLQPFKIGEGGAAIEARIVGPEKEILYDLADQFMRVMRETPNLESVRSNWGSRVNVLSFELSEARSRETGVTRPDVANSIAMNNMGVRGGVFRDGNDLLPIMLKVEEAGRSDVERLNDLQVWSSVFQSFLPIEQVVDEISTEWRSPVIHRFDRKRTVTVSGKQIEGTTASLFAQVRPQLEAIELPDGYRLEWGGEYESSTEANQKLGANVPAAFLMMLLISIILFNSFRHPIIIFTGLPLAIIGVTAGLLVTGQPFGFMATLGFLSLSGMLIKNEIVLLEQINIELGLGKTKFEAVVDAAVSRVRPVTMAAMTTVLGMIPLLWDPFFAAMAVTIMAGLTFATALTLIVVPLLYAIFFNVKKQKA
ncbi:MAG: efflux RND transporter permease subunit [Opitutales bacterium]|nr:efflux RND transporter permease subunit [Opitutales bacterium]